MKVKLRRKRPQAPPAVTRGEIEEALGAVRAAEARFNQVTEIDLVDAAVLEVTAARIRLNYMFRLKRGIA